LPAQYGLHTAGIVDITVKSGTTNPGAEVSVTGGSRDYSQPASPTGRTSAIDYLRPPVHPQRSGIEIRPRRSPSMTTPTSGRLAKITGIVDDNTLA
jgi:hypothetical protein